MKHYVGTVLEINGGMEYETPVIISCDDEADLEAVCKAAARDWRDAEEDDWNEVNGVYDSDSTWIYPFSVDRKIDETEVEVAHKYLPLIHVEG